MKNKKIIVVDLEATCWKVDGDYQRKHSEIIEIGICVLDTISGEITQNEGILVKPETSTISPFCTELTTITPQLVEKEGIFLAEAVEKLIKEYNSDNYPWASYGGYDKNMLKRQCKLKNIDYPFGESHLNVKEEYRRASGGRKSVGMKRALNQLKIPLDGTHHRGKDDAYNTAKILHWSLKKN